MALVARPPSFLGALLRVGAGVPFAHPGVAADLRQRAVFRLQVILGHLGASLELVDEPSLALEDAAWEDTPGDEAVGLAPVPPGAGVAESSILPWPLTDVLGKDIRRLFRGAALAGAR
eukprot:CAMPEP_0171094954 /NCGR_PEP_ID=MMETSP0766_2-20121228/42901_1 /TAXON_ID=439317 /ORGANISM="Gambierdiscus australes, Strain CAWD 149" /LENGTH=117 /DNA_ID=CAMNT_0011553705 /DNA_START=40 /DNA_END=390 /DNA_ORIENTATION=-